MPEQDRPPPESAAEKAQREEYARWRMLGASGIAAYRRSLQAFSAAQEAARCPRCGRSADAIQVYGHRPPCTRS